MAGAGRISLPTEHGAWITVTGAAALAIFLAPQQLPAALAAAACLTGFVARGPVERRAAGHRLGAGDRLLLGGCVAVIAAALLLSPAGLPALALVAATAAAFPLAGALARARRIHRTLPVELAGLAASGAVAGVVLIAGGDTADRAVIVGAVLATYAAATVVGVRGEARRAPAAQGRRRGLVGLAISTGAAIALAFVPGMLLAAAGFVPRMIASAVRALRPGHRVHIYMIAVRECVALGAFLVLLAAAMR